MNVIGNNMKRIRKLQGLSLQQAAIKLNMTATGVQKYENGKIVPNSSKLITIANAYDVKASELLKKLPTITMKFNSFRKRNKLTGRKLDVVKDIILSEVQKNIEILSLNNIEYNTPLVNYTCNHIDEVDNIVEKFRTDFLNISIKQPVTNLTDILESMGIVIIYINNHIEYFDSFDGLSETVNKVPIIVLKKNQSDGARQRFTLAHELAHLILNINPELDEEKVCNKFASSLLLPKEAIINEIGKSRNQILFRELEILKQKYKVSYTAINYRLKDLNIISEYQYKNIQIKLTQTIGKNDPNPIEPEVSLHYEKSIHRLYAEDIITISKASEYLGISIEQYNKQINS